MLLYGKAQGGVEFRGLGKGWEARRGCNGATRVLKHVWEGSISLSGNAFGELLDDTPRKVTSLSLVFWDELSRSQDSRSNRLHSTPANYSHPNCESSMSKWNFDNQKGHASRHTCRSSQSLG